MTGWQNFYVIVGSSAGALIGLQFVVMTLIAQVPALRDGQGNLQRDAQRAGSAFGTPNVVHFSSALLLSAVQCVPWQALSHVRLTWGILGSVGVVYAAVVIRRMVTQTAYRPELEDWVFHALLPLIAYAALAASAWMARSDIRAALLVVAGTTLLLLFTGIHNAWDATTYHIYSTRSGPPHE